MASCRENGIGVNVTMATEEQLQSLVKKAEERERVARRRSFIYSLIPIILAGLFITFTGWQIQKKKQELDSVQKLLAQAEQQVNFLKNEAERYRREAAESKKRVEELNKSLETITDQLRLATNFLRYEFPGRIELSMKSLYSSYPESSRILGDIFRMQYQKVKWKLGGFSPEEGFDSPSFATFLLIKNHLLPASASSDRYRLRELLEGRGKPQIGGIVFYQYGYTMFYFEDEQRRPFVVGMTPLGILALKTDFAPIVGYASVNYPPSR